MNTQSSPTAAPASPPARKNNALIFILLAGIVACLGGAGILQLGKSGLTTGEMTPLIIAITIAVIALASFKVRAARAATRPAPTLEENALLQIRAGGALIALSFLAGLLAISGNGSLAWLIISGFGILIGTLVIGFGQVRIR